jgi:hypothetical protein
VNEDIPTLEKKSNTVIDTKKKKEYEMKKLPQGVGGMKS